MKFKIFPLFQQIKIHDALYSKTMLNTCKNTSIRCYEEPDQNYFDINSY